MKQLSKIEMIKIEGGARPPQSIDYDQGGGGSGWDFVAKYIGAVAAGVSANPLALAAAGAWIIGQEVNLVRTMDPAWATMCSD